MNENQPSSRRQFWTGFLIAFCLLALPLLGLEFYIQHKYIKYFKGGLAALQPKKLENKIWLGNDLFTKKAFLADSRTGEITDMKSLKLAGNAAVRLGVAGKSGAVFTDSLGNSLKAVTFIKTQYSDVELLPSAKKGTCQFRERGSWSVPAALLDESGRELWSYGGSTGLAVGDSAAGDLNGNGELEFAVGFNDGAGIHLLDSKGKKLWEKKGGNVWHVEMADVSGHAPLRIVYSDALKMVVRDKNGNVLSEKKPKSYLCHFSMVHWPLPTSRSWPLSQDNDVLWILDFQGNSLAGYYAPKSPGLDAARAVPFMFRGEKRPGLAAIVSGRYPTAGSNLYFYSADGRLLYHESSSEIFRSLLALPRAGGAEDTLLVGGNGRVWQYALQAGVDAKNLKNAGIPSSDFIGAGALAIEGLRLHAAGKFDEAEKALRKVLAIRESAGEEDEAALAAPLVALANWCSDTAHYSEGDTLYLRAEKIIEKVHGPDSQDLAGCLNYHAIMLKKAGNWDGVELIWRHVQKIRENNPELELPSAKDLERELKEASARKAGNKRAIEMEQGNKESSPQADSLKEKLAGILKWFKGASKATSREDESSAAIDLKNFEVDPAKADAVEAQWQAAGMNLNEEQVNELRNALKKNENDVESRFKLFIYLSTKPPRFNDPKVKAEYAGHYFWLIEHLPRSFVFSQARLYDGLDSSDDYEKSLKVWGKLAAENPKDAVVLGHAAKQYYRKMEQAIVYFDMAKKADPNNPQRYFDWGCYVLGCVNDGERNDIDRGRAKAAMRLFQEGMLKPGAESLPFKEHLCWAAWKADDFAATKKYAKIALDSLANTVQSNTDQKSGLLYAGNSVLGLLDLRRGDIKSSVNHMIASAISKSGYVPNSFGMDFELARLLFDKGEKDAVINFLNETAIFRENYNAPKWIELIKAGKKPDFKRF